MKRFFLISLALVFVSSFTVTLSFAQGNRPLKDKMKNSSEAAEKRQEKMEEKTEDAMERLKEKAEKAIERRIERLEKLIDRIGEMKKLSASDKASLTSEVQAEIDSLKALLAKIQADTDLETLRTDVKSIVDSHRIFALFIPKIQIIGAADRMLNIADQMSSQAARLEIKINEAEANGNDVVELESLLSDMKTNIEEAKTQANGAISAVDNLEPEDFDKDETLDTLKDARQMVVDALHNLNEARQDARKIIVGLLQFGKKSATPTVTTAPTATPTI
jgi:chromosome segregation ATPase